MQKTFYNLNPRQNISGGLAFVLVGLLSVLLSWYVVGKSESIVEDVTNSPIVRLDERKAQTEKELKYEQKSERSKTPIFQGGKNVQTER